MNEITPELLAEFKDRMKLSDDEDQNLTRILKSSIEDLSYKCGPYDMATSETFKELVFERSRYAYNDALEFFDVNFLKQITVLALAIPGDSGGGTVEPGAPGAPGKSAYDLAVENGFIGSVEEWILSLRGEPGLPGPAGKDGTDATVTKNSITSALGYTPVNENDFTTHANDDNRHLTADRINLFTELKPGNAILSTTDQNRNPVYYYTLKAQTLWERFFSLELLIPGALEGERCVVSTMIGYPAASEHRILQQAFTLRGIYYRRSQGVDAATATWSVWSKMLMSDDMTAANIISALGYTPTDDALASAHMFDTTVHLTPGEKFNLFEYTHGSSIRVSGWEEPAITPAAYYAMDARIIWENWACAKLNIPVNSTEMWSPICTIIPFNLAEDKLIQIAYTVEGTFIRYTVGDQNATATWGTWSKFITNDDLQNLDDITEHETSSAPHQYGGKFEWRYNAATNSLDLVVLD